ncbi:MAG: ABC transporter substrate-binding protein [Candidatus Lokiarchaeota archaeon]|nr:ABC transporter substrate-binding protein [Candidatus Lokiarchaeota archaeon]
MTGEKAPSERKIPKIKELKKPILIAGIIAVIAIAGIVAGIVIMGEIEKKRGGTLVLGVTGTLNYLDPIEGWPESSSAIITQIVTEALFALEGIHNRSRLIPNLATEYDWSDNNTELTCYLRKNVEFHDGTPFNATAVKWNIDRNQRLMTDPIDSWGGTNPAYLWQFPDGNWIINETKVLDEYTVKFVLNKPFVPLLSLLATPYSLMLSPSSTPDNEFNGIIPGTLYGTGAFIYSAYEGGNNITLAPNPDYWGGRPAFDNVIISLFSNDTVRYEAMLSGELSMTWAGSWSDEDRDLLMNTTGIELEETLGPFPGMYYIFMNNNVINATMRKAISYAFNFSAYVSLFDLFGKPVSSIFPPIRSESPIPKGMLYSHWGSFDMPYFNISIARQALKDVNWPETAGLTANHNISAGNEWELLVTEGTPLATYNHSFPIGTLDDNLFVLLNESLKQIGVKFEQTPNMTWDKLGIFDKLGILRVGWQADYNDPISMINPLFSNKTDGVWNFGQVNDSLVQLWMEEALEETNETAREQLYFKIEKRLIEEVYPAIWCEMAFSYDVYVSNLHWTPDLGVFTIKDWYFD